MSYNSHGLLLSANEPFDSKDEAIKKEDDIKYEIMVSEKGNRRKLVKDTDIGKKLEEEIEDLKELIEAYKDGMIS